MSLSISVSKLLVSKYAKAVGRVAGYLAATQDPVLFERVCFWGHVSDEVLSGDLPSEAQHAQACGELVQLLEAPAPSVAVMHRGRLGLAWALAHVTESDSASELTYYDEQLLTALSEPSHPLAWDLAGGVAGVALYAKVRDDRGEHELGQALGAHVVRILSQRTAGGESIWSLGSTDGGPGGAAPTLGGARVNCGMAHGIPGIAAALGNLAEMDVPGAGALLRHVMQWMDVCWLPDGATNQLPDYVTKEGAGKPARTGWCYGDLGAIVGLLNASRRAGLPEQELWTRAYTCANRPLRLADYHDAGLCHGMMGVSHLFYRLFLASRDKVFADAAATSMARAFDYEDAEDGMGGFGAAAIGDDGREFRVGNARLLAGSVGVVLSMQAMIRGDVPLWDQCLGIDIPVAAK